MNNCKNCNCEIGSRNKFCSQSCSAKFSNRGRKMSDESKDKISNKLSKKYDIQLIHILVSEGKTAKEIAEIIGVGDSTMTKIIKENNIVLIKKPKPKTNKCEIKNKSYLDANTLCSKHNVNYTFNNSKNRYDCSACNVENVTNYRKRKKQLAIDYKGGECMICGYKKYAGSLEFHHLDPNEKDFTISQKSLSFEEMKSELDKCVLLCANCHREVHGGLIDVILKSDKE